MRLVIQSNLDHDGTLYPKGSVLEVGDELGQKFLDDGVAIQFAEPQAKTAKSAAPVEPEAPTEPEAPAEVQPSEPVAPDSKSDEEVTTPAPEASVEPSSNVQEQQVPVSVKE
jgi:hypothetical protein